MLQRLIYIYFIYLILEGAFRKWFLPGLSQELFLLKDLMLAFGAFLIIGQATLYRRSLVSQALNRRDIFIWGMWVLFFTGHIFTSGVSLPGIIGLRYYLIMLPILVLLPIAIRDMDHLNAMVLKYFYLAIPVGLLGVVQSLSPASSRINSYAWTSGDIAVVSLGEKSARITGTFSYIAPYAIYLQCMLLVGLCLYLTDKTSREKFIIVLASVLIFANIAMTGSRAPFLIVAVLSIPLLLKIARTREIRQFSTVGTLLVVGVLMFALADPFSLLAERHKGSGDTRLRVEGTLLIPFYTFQNATFTGKGVGSTFGGLAEATGTQAEDTGFDEVTMDRIGIEVGVFGYLFVLMVKLAYMVETFLFYRRVPDENIRVWTLGSLLFQLSMLWTIPVYNSVAAAYYFASLAIFIKMRSFARDRVMVPAQ